MQITSLCRWIKEDINRWISQACGVVTARLNSASSEPTRACSSPAGPVQSATRWGKGASRLVRLGGVYSIQLNCYWNGTPTTISILERHNVNVRGLIVHAVHSLQRSSLPDDRRLKRPHSTSLTIMGITIRPRETTPAESQCTFTTAFSFSMNFTAHGYGPNIEFHSPYALTKGAVIATKWYEGLKTVEIVDRIYSAACRSSGL